MQQGTVSSADRLSQGVIDGRKYGEYLKKRYFADQLSDSGKLASFQNGAPNTLWFPWKLPETQSAGDPMVSLWVAGNLRVP